MIAPLSPTHKKVLTPISYEIKSIEQLNFGLLELLCWFSVLANDGGSILLWTGFGRN
jgi:hypothetical protein